MVLEDGEEGGLVGADWVSWDTRERGRGTYLVADVGYVLVVEVVQTLNEGGGAAVEGD